MSNYERWRQRKVRICRSVHECALCGQDLTYGRDYHDGGYGRRAHVECVKALAPHDGSPVVPKKGIPF